LYPPYIYASCLITINNWLAFDRDAGFLSRDKNDLLHDFKLPRIYEDRLIKRADGLFRRAVTLGREDYLKCKVNETNFLVYKTVKYFCLYYLYTLLEAIKIVVSWKQNII
jgi:hypothetical protein